MTDLEIAANKFKEWRGDRRHYRYPKHFWDQIRDFANHYPLPVIASSYDINVGYLRHKISKNTDSITFAPLNITSSQSSVSIEFADRNSQAMTVRLQASHDELIRIILSLSGA